MTVLILKCFIYLSTKKQFPENVFYNKKNIKVNHLCIYITYFFNNFDNKKFIFIQILKQDFMIEKSKGLRKFINTFFFLSMIPLIFLFNNIFTIKYFTFFLDTPRLSD